MKRLSKLFIVALFLCSSGAFAQTVPSHKKYVKLGSDSQKWYEAYNNWTPGTPLYKDDADAAENENFFISRVKPRERFTFTGTQVKEGLNPQRKLLWWCPINESSWNALPSYFFNGEAFTMWSYTDIYGNWTAPMIQAPAAFLDACRKNGVASGVVAAIGFGASPTPTDGGSGQMITTMINKGSDNLLKYLNYYGIDGIGWNSEFSWTGLNASGFKNLMGDCYAKAASAGVPLFNNAWYSFTSNAGGIGDYSVLNSSCSDWFNYNGKTVSSAYFLNYNWGAIQLATSQSTARGFAGRSSFDVFGGMDFQGRSAASWLALQNYDISFGIWGAHNTNMMLINQGENGSSPKQKQATYQLISENVFTGSSYNPVNTPAVKNILLHTSKAKDFHGFSSFIVARSTLTCDDLAADPFVTYFNVGNGQFFNINGEKNFTGDWYNLGIQDYLPTWRWWWTKSFMGKSASDAATDMTAAFTWDDAWFAGSCLQISGATTNSYLQLFKTKYKTASAGDYITIRYKVLSGSGSMYWACTTEESLNEISATIKANATKTDGWVELRTAIGTGRSALKVQNATLALIGLKFANTSSDFKVLIGEMSLTRGTSATPNAPVIEKAKVMDYNYKGVNMKVIFKMNSSKSAPVYNADVDTWYFRIYTRQEGKEPVVCTATNSWAAYVVGAPYDIEAGGRMQIGVAAVSLDGKSESAISWSEYITLPTPDIIEGTEIDKPIIKVGETFKINFSDPNHSTAKWEIINATTGNTEYTLQNGLGVTTSLNKVGVYDVKITSNDGTISYTRGQIQVSPMSTGAIPTIGSFSSDKMYANEGETINLSYMASRLGEGKVSRAVRIDDPYMIHFPTMIPTRPYTYMMWFKLEAISHDTQGTNLINKFKKDDTWPHGNWGDFWVTLRPSNEISFNVYGWTAHDNPNTDMMSTGYSVNEGQWTHIAVTLNSDNTEKMYFNGKLVASTIDSKVSNNGQRVNGDVYIGGSNTYKSGVNGWIDDFQVWNRVLSDSEVAAAMNGYEEGETIPEGLLGFWDFETINPDGYTFPNRGTLGATYAADYVEWTSSATGNVRKLPNNDQLGNAILNGSLEIKTDSVWTLTDASVKNIGGTLSNGQAVISYNAAGTYKPQLTLENMWGSDSKTIDAIQVTSTGIEDATVAEILGVYPNPFTDFVNILFSEGGKYTTQIVALDGKLIETKELNVSAGEGVRVDVNGDKGTYILRILNDKNVAVRTIKIVKN